MKALVDTDTNTGIYENQLVGVPSIAHSVDVSAAGFNGNKVVFMDTSEAKKKTNIDLFLERLTDEQKSDFYNDLKESFKMAEEINNSEYFFDALREWGLAIEVGYPEQLKKSIDKSKKDIADGKVVQWEEIKKKYDL